MTTTSPQVLVVGAGPVGLTAAHELARRGIPVRLVDAAPGPATTSRALATHARSLEVYDQMGVLDDLLPRGQRVEHFTLHQSGRRLVRFDTDYSRLPTRFPFTLMVDQATTEEVLRSAAARHGVKVEWGVRLEEFEDRGDTVHAVLRHSDGRAETATAAWLVGCDGGHSTVRGQLGLRLAGDSTETWLIADAHVDCALPRDSIHWLRTRTGTVMMVPFPEPGKWRLLDTAEVGYASEQALAERFARKIAEGGGGRVTVRRPSWVSVFTIQQRMIDTMRAGRCLVAGDAAHVHSPASGQGMNTGIQDAVNLAWRLAAVLDGADDSLLDGYSSERVPVGAALLKSTGMATALIQLNNKYAAAALRAVFAVVRTVGPLKSRIQRKIMGGMSALDLCYAHASAPDDRGRRVARVTAGRLASSPGWREVLAALREPRWTLLVGGPAQAVRAPCPEGYEEAVTVLGVEDPAVREDLAVRAGGWVLVRPDGYVAGRGTELTEPALRALLPARA